MTTASFSVCGASLLTVTVISIDRLLAIQYHLRYAGVVTVQRVVYAITLNWLISGFLANFTLLGWEKIFLVVTTLTVAICLCVSTYSHAKLIVLLAAINKKFKHKRRQYKLEMV